MKVWTMLLVVLSIGLGGGLLGGAQAWSSGARLPPRRLPMTDVQRAPWWRINQSSSKSATR